MTVYFYGRNSDLESFDKKSSIETQLSKCKSYANIKDLKIDVAAKLFMEFFLYRIPGVSKILIFGIFFNFFLCQSLVVPFVEWIIFEFVPVKTL